MCQEFIIKILFNPHKSLKQMLFLISVLEIIKQRFRKMN